MNFFPLNLQILRKSKGLKQSDMEQIGFKRTTWNNYESGASQPNIDGILTIAKYFDVKIDDLLSRDLSQDDQLMEKVDSIKKVVRNSPDNSRSDILNESELHYSATEKEEIIEGLKKIIETQQSLIDSLNENILLLKKQGSNSDMNHELPK